MSHPFVFREKSGDQLRGGSFKLRPLGTETSGSRVVIRWALSAEQSEDEFVVEHATGEQFKDCIVPTNSGDHAVLSVFFHILRYGARLHIDGVVSPTLLKGLETLQTIWSRWCPRLYSPITFTATEESELTVQHTYPGSIVAFSGGVDGTFSTFRHHKSAVGRNSTPPSAALLVHGMDIPLNRPDDYQGAVERAHRMLQGTSISLIEASTNSRQLRQEWEHSFSVQLGACFLLLQRGFATALLGSGEPYETIYFPWSSTPMTDHLMSTPSMAVVIDGGGFSRTEKVNWLVNHTAVSDQLRVCWQGTSLDRNCGHCEKCVRTMLNFWASKHAVPKGLFNADLSTSAIRSLRPRNEVQLKELQHVLSAAQRAGLSGSTEFKALRAVIRRSQIAAGIARFASYFRSAIWSK